MSSINQKAIMAVLFVGVLMGALDLAIIGPALPGRRVGQCVLPWAGSVTGVRRGETVTAAEKLATSLDEPGREGRWTRQGSRRACAQA